MMVKAVINLDEVWWWRLLACHVVALSAALRWLRAS